MGLNSFGLREVGTWLLFWVILIHGTHGNQQIVPLIGSAPNRDPNIQAPTKKGLKIWTDLGEPIFVCNDCDNHEEEDECDDDHNQTEESSGNNRWVKWVIIMLLVVCCSWVLCLCIPLDSKDIRPELAMDAEDPMCRKEGDLNLAQLYQEISRTLDRYNEFMDRIEKSQIFSPQPVAPSPDGSGGQPPPSGTPGQISSPFSWGPPSMQPNTEAKPPAQAQSTPVRASPLTVDQKQSYLPSSPLLPGSPLAQKAQQQFVSPNSKLQPSGTSPIKPGQMQMGQMSMAQRNKAWKDACKKTSLPIYVPPVSKRCKKIITRSGERSRCKMRMAVDCYRPSIRVQTTPPKKKPVESPLGSSSDHTEQ